MSTKINWVYRVFKRNCKIEGALIYKFGSIKEFKISIQYDVQNIDVHSKTQKLYFLVEHLFLKKWFLVL